MQFTEIVIKVNTADVETASAIANMAAPYGIYVEDYSDLREGVEQIAHIDLIDEELLKKDKNTAYIHIYLSECDNPAEAGVYVKERLAAAGIAGEVDSKTVDDGDWNENWKKYFKPLEIGERLAVCPSWERYENPQNRKVLKLDPGAAFGTGTHATTCLCMELLEKYVTPGCTMLDIGTGSGILCIAALLLGAGKTVGVDIDELAVKTARENAARNGVTEKCDFCVGDLAKTVKGRYNIVCANIVADVVIRLFEDVSAYMESGGALIVSGIIEMRAPDVETAARSHGFTVAEHLSREEWHAYVLRRD